MRYWDEKHEAMPLEQMERFQLEHLLGQASQQKEEKFLAKCFWVKYLL